MTDSAVGRARRVVRHKRGTVEDWPAWSRSGRFLAVVRQPFYGAHRGAAVLIVDAQTRRIRRVSTGYAPSWSPGGKRLVLVRPLPNERGFYDNGVVYVVTLASRKATRIGVGADPVWSPDGSQIAFFRHFKRRGAKETQFSRSRLFVYHVHSRVVREVRVRTPNKFGIPTELWGWPTWSPDSRRLAFEAKVVDADGGFIHESLLRFVNRDGSRDSALEDVIASICRWSPRSDVLACNPEGHPGALTLYSPDGFVRRELVPMRGPSDNVRPDWSPDGAQIAYVDCADARGVGCNLFVIDRGGTRRVKLTKRPSEWIGPPIWRPARRHVSVARGRGRVGLTVIADTTGAGGPTL
jgi:Tol biopolymer transport system component